MKFRILRDGLILLAVFGAIWAVFTFLPILPEEAPELISVEKEEELGEILIESILESEKEISNPKLDSAMHVLEQRLVEFIGHTDFDYKIYVVKNEQVNAFATLGGNIVIYSGIIEFSETPEELISVLAHEIGHVEERHLANRVIQELGLSVLFSIISGGDPILIGELVRSITSAAFNRSQEKEADQFALELMERSGINPKNLGKFFRRIEDEYGGFDKNLEFLMSHPHNNSRIKASFEYELSDDFEESPIMLDWDSVKESIVSSYDQ